MKQPVHPISRHPAVTYYAAVRPVEPALCLRNRQCPVSQSFGVAVLYEVGFPLPDGVRELIGQNVIREVSDWLLQQLMTGLIRLRPEGR